MFRETGLTLEEDLLPIIRPIASPLPEFANHSCQNKKFTRQPGNTRKDLKSEVFLMLFVSIT